jgi:hypothetical protein
MRDYSDTLLVRINGVFVTIASIGRSPPLGRTPQNFGRTAYTAWVNGMSSAAGAAGTAQKARKVTAGLQTAPRQGVARAPRKESRDQ